MSAPQAVIVIIDLDAAAETLRTGVFGPFDYDLAEFYAERIRNGTIVLDGMPDRALVLCSRLNPFPLSVLMTDLARSLAAVTHGRPTEPDNAESPSSTL